MKGLTRHTLTSKFPEEVMNENGEALRISFFALKDQEKKTCEGVGFQVMGGKVTSFWTFSDSDLLTVYDRDGAHHTDHLVRRGLLLSSPELFHQEWEKVWWKYKGIRSQFPPITYSLSDAKEAGVLSANALAYLRELGL